MTSPWLSNYSDVCLFIQLEFKYYRLSSGEIMVYKIDIAYGFTELTGQRWRRWQETVVYQMYILPECRYFKENIWYAVIVNTKAGDPVRIDRVVREGLSDFAELIRTTCSRSIAFKREEKNKLKIGTYHNMVTGQHTKWLHWAIYQDVVYDT